MIRFAAAFGLALAVAGCATAPPAPPASAAIPAAFEMSGRIALRQGGRSEIARLRWSRGTRGDVWVLASPIGNEIARIESGVTGAALMQGGSPRQEAASFAELTQALLGVALEPNLLAAWLHGDTTQAAPSGWKVTVGEALEGRDPRVARRLEATRGDVEVRLVVDEYRLPGERP